MHFENNLKFAQELDSSDELAAFRNEFYIPQVNGKDSYYFTGNSLGLQPKSVRSAVETELKDWEDYGVEGHFHGTHPWFHYHKFLTEDAAHLVNAKPLEVVIMNNLTVNLHFMMVSFYQPKGKRYKIVMEGGAFPSDMYAIESQVKFHGYEYDDAVIEVTPRAGEHHLRTEDILDTLENNRDEIALVLFSGVQYYTGQFFNMPIITKKAHEIGAYCGWDLAHAVGNVELHLHEWEVDFAVWCSYKYLNSGPGGVSGVFVHENHSNSPELPRFAGWWGHKESERFQMKRGYIPEEGAAGWQLSNAPVLSMSAHMASLKIFRTAGVDKLYSKGKMLNAYMEFVLRDISQRHDALNFEIITPEERGCQLSVLTGENGKAMFDYLTEQGVIADWREPNVIRMAAVPLYNKYEDIYRLGEILMSFS